MVALYCTLETLQNATDPARASETIRQLLLFIFITENNSRELLLVQFPIIKTIGKDFLYL